MPRGNPKYIFRSDDFPLFDDYDGSPAKITQLVSHFESKWGMTVPRWVVIRMAQRLHKTHVKEPYWTERDENYLRDHFGVIPDVHLCKYLHRTRVSIVLKAKRLHINRKINLNTARSVALICGIPDSKTVMMWVRKGLLKAKKSPSKCGGNRMWNIDDSSLASMLKVQPWLAYIPEMPDSYYKRLVEREWHRDPWYNREQVGKMLGVGPEYVRRYIKRGWLQGVKVPGGRHTQVRWMFRASWVMAFLQDDPRNKYHRKMLSLTKRAKHLLFDDDPVHLYGAWLLKCPRCNRMVVVAVSSKHNWATRVMKKYLNSLDGHHECVHGHYVALEGTDALFKLQVEDKKSSS